jgi:hypothetical protein
MERPVYEIEADVRRAEIAVHAARAALKLRPIPTPKMSPVDYGMWNGPVREMWLEVKTRSVDHDRFDTAFLFASKWKALRALDGPVGLWIQWADWIYGLCRVDLCPDLEAVERNGRRDRNDPQDIQPVVYIPLNWFSLYTPTGLLISSGRHNGSRTTG